MFCEAFERGSISFKKGDSADSCALRLKGIHWVFYG